MTVGDGNDCTTIRPNGAGRGALVAVALVCGIIGAGMVVAGFASLRDPGPATGLLPLGVLLLLAVVGLRSVVTAPAVGRLTLGVCPDRLVFERAGEVVDRVPRSEAGVVIVDGYTRSGVLALAVYGPDRELVGMWDTGWTAKSPRRTLAALDRHGYPWVTPALDRIWRRSGNAPPWADDVDYLAPRLSRNQAR